MGARGWLGHSQSGGTPRPLGVAVRHAQRPPGVAHGHPKPAIFSSFFFLKFIYLFFNKFIFFY
jgi:hypothetical protein